MRLVLLDRDGVINKDSINYIKSPQEWEPIPGSLEAIALLNKAGIKVAIVSNQSGLARGYFTEETLKKIHSKMRQELAKVKGHIDEIYYCPHGPDEQCACRKPQPGLALQALKDFQAIAENTCFVGDSASDMLCARRAGCRPILVNSGKEDISSHFPDILSYPDLLSFAQAFLGNLS